MPKKIVQENCFNLLTRTTILTGTSNNQQKRPSTGNSRSPEEIRKRRIRERRTSLSGQRTGFARCHFESFQLNAPWDRLRPLWHEIFWLSISGDRTYIGRYIIMECLAINNRKPLRTLIYCWDENTRLNFKCILRGRRIRPWFCRTIGPFLGIEELRCFMRQTRPYEALQNYLPPRWWTT